MPGFTLLLHRFHPIWWGFRCIYPALENDLGYKKAPFWRIFKIPNRTPKISTFGDKKCQVFTSPKIRVSAGKKIECRTPNFGERDKKSLKSEHQNQKQQKNTNPLRFPQNYDKMTKITDLP